MNNLTNYHTHTLFCDGKAEPEAFVSAALERNFIALGFSAHAPAPKQEAWTLTPESIPPYLAAVEELKQRYAGKIEIYSGMEVDYIPGYTGPSSPEIQNLGLDYTLGGVHIIELEETGEYLTVDGPQKEFERILKLQFHGDRKALVTHFFSLVRRMAEEHKPDMIAHFDLIKVRNKGEEHYRENEGWYKNAVLEALESIARSGAVLEINTGGLSRGKSDSLYPSTWILREARDAGIPVTVNSDVHVPEGIDALFPEAAAAAKKAGYTAKRVLLDGSWQDMPL